MAGWGNGWQGVIYTLNQPSVCGGVSPIAGFIGTGIKVWKQVSSHSITSSDLLMAIFLFST